MAIEAWQGVHPLLKIIPVEWDFNIPYGLLHSDHPSESVQKLLSALHTIMESDL